jgi:hypothetical protein
MASIKENDILIVDEADVFVFDQTSEFANLIEGRRCICFTATTSNGEKHDSERITLNGFNFTMLKAYHESFVASIKDVHIERVADAATFAYIVRALG